jgi:hypothetical protein
MPVRISKDNKGCFAQWGNSGAKYRYTCGNTGAMNKAKQKAHLQAAAANKAGYKEEGKTVMQIAFEKATNEKRGAGWYKTPDGKWLKGILKTKPEKI